MRRLSAVALCGLLSTVACAESPGVDLPDNASLVGNRCDDPRYGDGTCDVNNNWTCAVPDVDCFKVFDSFRDVVAWYTAVSPWLDTVWGVCAPEGGLAPGAAAELYAETHPLTVRAQKLLDQAWAAFVRVHPVGALSDQRPIAHVIKSEENNASNLAIEENGEILSTLTVTVHDAALREETDAVLFATMLHELAHSIRIHSRTRDDLMRWYAAPRGSEPSGINQRNNPALQAAGTAWMQAEAWASDASERLGGMPMRGWQSDIFKAARLALGEPVPACAAALAAYDQARTRWLRGVSQLDDTFDDRFVELGEANRLQKALAEACFAGTRIDYFEVLAAYECRPKAAIAGEYSDSLRTMMNGKDFMTQLGLVLARTRQRMRAVEAAMRTDLGIEFSQLRVYDQEEDADRIADLVLARTSPGSRRWADVARDGYDGIGEECVATLAARRIPGYGSISRSHRPACFRWYRSLQIYQAAGLRARARMAEPTSGSLREFPPLGIPEVPMLKRVRGKSLPMPVRVIDAGLRG